MTHALLSSSAIYAFFGACIVFLSISAIAAKRIQSPKDFFQNKSSPKNAISLAIANITFAAGILYPWSLGAQYGATALIMPASILFGYLLLARMTTLHGTIILKDYNVFRYLNSTYDGPRWIGNLPTFSLCLIFIILLALEIFKTSEILVPVFFPDGGVLHQSLVSAVIFATTLLYTAWGGIRVVFRTDIIQSLIVIALIALIITIAPTSSQASSQNSAQWNHQDYLILIVAILSAIATQFYNVLNIATVARVSPEDRKRTLLWAAGLLAAVNAVFVIMGASTSASPAELLSVSAIALITNEILAVAAVAVVAIGLGSIIFATVDSLIIAIANLTYDNVLGMDSQSGEKNLGQVRKIRFYILAAFTFVFIFLTFFYYATPDVIPALFAITSGGVVYAPFVYVSMKLAKNARDHSAPSFNSFTHLLYFAIFLVAIATNIYGMSISQDISYYVFIAAAILSSAFSVILFFRNRRNEAV